ncbi:MAG: peptidoglycan-binding protein [Oscillospiraceae bacterium]|nr:peptidoglycan-binding protein [Oscillospiraceae bacterium]
MTIAEAKQKLVAWANAQVGYAETGDNRNKYAQGKYAAYGWDVQSQPWCDVFVDAGFIETFGLELAAKLTYQPRGAFSALCSRSAQYYKNNGAYFCSPEIGDQVFFNVSGGINHTGIVVAVSGGVVTAVEGNSSDMVRRNAYGIGSSYINGYGRPNWGIFAEEMPSQSSTQPAAPQKEQTCTVTVTLPVVNYGDKGEYVKLMQQRLIAKGFSCGVWGADGDYGNGTKQALLTFQREQGIGQDAICGQQSWTKLF